VVETVEEVRPNLFRIVVPLPNSPLKEINSYVFTSAKRSLIVDTGMNRPECLEVLEAGIAAIGIDLERTDFVATHLHADHQGLISTLMRNGSRAYMGALDAPAFGEGTGDTWSKDGFMGDFGRRSGFPAEDLEASMQNHPGFRYSGSAPVDYIALAEGDTFDVGDYHLRVIDTPGHTQGHVCLFDAKAKIFLSGDHVLGDITPNIATWSNEGDPLGDYLESLKKVAGFDVQLCLPGHRSVIEHFDARLDELVEHHRERANEVLDILDAGEANAYDTAGGMTWSIRAACWEDFPVMQRWFATGEAIAHLRYLEYKQLVRCREADGNFIYSRVGLTRL
jgi:glyoxylase-like metal-dependent hydrolase (beta-lactamase superfamily II)